MGASRSRVGQRRAPLTAASSWPPTRCHRSRRHGIGPRTVPLHRHWLAAGEGSPAWRAITPDGINNNRDSAAFLSTSWQSNRFWMSGRGGCHCTGEGGCQGLALGRCWRTFRPGRRFGATATSPRVGRASFPGWPRKGEMTPSPAGRAYWSSATATCRATSAADRASRSGESRGEQSAAGCAIICPAGNGRGAYPFSTWPPTIAGRQGPNAAPVVARGLVPRRPVGPTNAAGDKPPRYIRRPVCRT